MIKAAYGPGHEAPGWSAACSGSCGAVAEPWRGVVVVMIRRKGMVRPRTSRSSSSGGAARCGVVAPGRPSLAVRAVLPGPEGTPGAPPCAEQSVDQEGGLKDDCGRDRGELRCEDTCKEK